MSAYSDTVAVWFWPLDAIRVASDLTDTLLGAQQVVTARLPKIAQAIQTPWAADRPELSRMLNEKAAAFSSSGRAAEAAGLIVCTAAQANVRIIEKLARGSWLWPTDWIDVAKQNLAATAALLTLPAATLAPVRDTVSANKRRLTGMPLS